MLSKTLIRWYRAARRRLPWRQTDDPYQIWLSEVMLQQTQVKTAIPYYFKFLDRFPTLEDLARAHPDQVLKLWEGLGYYARARNFHKAAGLVVAEHQGQIPSDPEAFKALPGVGDYIGAAVLSIAFGRRLAVVDGNVKRVLSRLFCLDVPVNKAGSHKAFQPYADRMIQEDEAWNAPAQFNQGMMELGALICTPKAPDCGACPVSSFCQAFKTGRVTDFPRRVKPKKTPLVHISAGVVRKGSRLLITKRSPEGLLGGLWEFPGGKILAGESPESACTREILEETGLNIRLDAPLTTITHAYTHFKIKMAVFLCTWESGRVCLAGPVDYDWVKPEDLKSFAFPKANHKFIPDIPPFSQWPGRPPGVKP